MHGKENPANRAHRGVHSHSKHLRLDCSRLELKVEHNGICRHLEQLECHIYEDLSRRIILDDPEGIYDLHRRLLDRAEHIHDVLPSIDEVLRGLPLVLVEVEILAGGLDDVHLGLLLLPHILENTSYNLICHSGGVILYTSVGNRLLGQTYSSLPLGENLSENILDVLEILVFRLCVEEVGLLLVLGGVEFLDIVSKLLVVRPSLSPSIARDESLLNLVVARLNLLQLGRVKKVEVCLEFFQFLPHILEGGSRDYLQIVKHLHIHICILELLPLVLLVLLLRLLADSVLHLAADILVKASLLESGYLRQSLRLFEFNLDGLGILLLEILGVSLQL